MKKKTLRNSFLILYISRWVNNYSKYYRKIWLVIRIPTATLQFFFACEIHLESFNRIQSIFLVKLFFFYLTCLIFQVKKKKEKQLWTLAGIPFKACFSPCYKPETLLIFFWTKKKIVDLPSVAHCTHVPKLEHVRHYSKWMHVYLFIFRPKRMMRVEILSSADVPLGFPFRCHFSSSAIRNTRSVISSKNYLPPGFKSVFPNLGDVPF